MQTPSPQSLTEEHFMSAASVALSIADAEINRNEWGVLHYYWSSPCPEIGGLSLYVTEREVTLSTNIAHTHVEGRDFWRDNLSKTDLCKKVAEEGVERARLIMGGETVFIKHYDTLGRELSGNGIWTRQQWIEENIQRADRSCERAWNWTEEVTT